jgi:hypothetical protein
VSHTLPVPRRGYSAPSIYHIAPDIYRPCHACVALHKNRRYTRCATYTLRGALAWAWAWARAPTQAGTRGRNAGEGTSTSSGLGTGIGTDTSTGPETGTGTETGADVGADTGADVGTYTGVYPGMGVDAGTGTGTGRGADTDTGTDTGAGAGTGVRTHTGPRLVDSCVPQHSTHIAQLSPYTRPIWQYPHIVPRPSTSTSHKPHIMPHTHRHTHTSRCAHITLRLVSYVRTLHCSRTRRRTHPVVRTSPYTHAPLHLRQSAHVSPHHTLHYTRLAPYTSRTIHG